ncbi:MAG: hypothetical protein ACC707_19185 [Thiohalomonadales bacterium]
MKRRYLNAGFGVSVADTIIRMSVLGHVGLRWVTPVPGISALPVDFNGACPLLGQSTGLKDFSLQGLALFPDLCLPLIGAAFSEGCHSHAPLVRERV